MTVKNDKYQVCAHATSKPHFSSYYHSNFHLENIQNTIRLFLLIDHNCEVSSINMRVAHYIWIT